MRTLAFVVVLAGCSKKADQDPPPAAPSPAAPAEAKPAPAVPAAPKITCKTDEAQPFWCALDETGADQVAICTDMKSLRVTVRTKGASFEKTASGDLSTTFELISRTAVGQAFSGYLGFEQDGGRWQVYSEPTDVNDPTTAASNHGLRQAGGKVKLPCVEPAKDKMYLLEQVLTPKKQ